MIQPAHLMRLWIWNILQKRGMEKINGLIPVVPVEDHRELAESGMPYIVYGYNIMPKETYHEGAMAFNIRSESQPLANKYSRVIGEAFNWVGAAENINYFFKDNYGDPGPVRITSTSTESYDSGTPEETEGAETWSLVIVNFTAVIDDEFEWPSNKGLWQ